MFQNILVPEAILWQVGREHVLLDVSRRSVERNMGTEAASETQSKDDFPSDPAPPSIAQRSPNTTRRLFMWR